MSDRDAHRSRKGTRQKRQLSGLMGGLLAIVTCLTIFPTAANAANAPKPKRGGTIIMGYPGTASNLDPDLTYIQYENYGPPMSALYGELAYLNPTTGAVVPSFLQSITPSHNYSAYTLVLHKGLKFSDGTAFNAQAIAFNLARMGAPTSGDTYQAAIAKLSVKVVNATTLRVTLPTTDTGFAAEMTQEFPYIASPTAIQAEGSGYGVNPVGAGPFKISSWAIGSSITMVRNSYYSRFAPGQPYLDGVTFQNLTSYPAEITALGAHEIQMGYLPGALYMNQARQAGAIVEQHRGGGGQFLQMNTAVPPFNNPLAREAVSLAINTNLLANAWSPGSGPVTNIFSKKSPFYDPKYNIPETTDQAKAQSLFNQLAASGDPVNFTITVSTGFPSIPAFVQSVLDAYQNVNVKVNLVLPSVVTVDEVQGNFQMTTGGANFANPIPSLYQDFAATGSLNYGHWNDPVATAALNTILSTTSVSAQKKQWGIVEHELATSWPIIWSYATDLGLPYVPSAVGNVTGIEFGTVPNWGIIYAK